MATEVELKFYCSPDDIAHIEAHPLIAASVEAAPAKLLENTYYDTLDLALHQERIALRIRNTPTEQLQTVKCAAKSMAGLSARPEWETPYAGSFEFSAIDARKVRSFLDERKSRLVPVFTTSFERRAWRIDVSKKIAIWVMLDSGFVSSGDHCVPISEVELELAQGAPEDLLDFAIALATHLPLLPHDVSKAERGYQLFLKQIPGPQKASPSPLSIKHNAAEAFNLLAGQGMRTWQANLLGTLTTSDQEFVHQFRVSLRRLNSLIKVFKPALPGRYQTRWTKRVKALSQITGDVRDLDVMRSGILEPMLDCNESSSQAHAKAAIAILDKTKQEALAEVQQLHYGGPVLLFARELQDLDTAGFPNNLHRFAEKQLAELHRNALKRLTKTLKTPTPENAHRFRIALKHLRYSCEFFAPLFDNEEMVEYAKAIAGLQDAFGFINDFHAALSRLQIWVEKAAINLKVREAVAKWHAPQAQIVLTNALQLSEAVMSRCQPWCTECERRGLSAIRRRMHYEITLQVD
jgi:adenylate cyclase